jgi:ATP-dependent RNA helicase DHX29
MFSGVVIIDGNRLRFSLADWKVMLALKNLRASLLEITIMSFRSPGKKISVQQQVWFDIWQQVFTLAQKKLARSKH